MRKAAVIIMAALLMFLGAKFVYAQENVAVENKVEPKSTVEAVAGGNTPVDSAAAVVQEPTVPAVKEEAKQPAIAPVAEDPVTVQWLWGQVVSADTANNELLINYLDYESDTEKQVKINVNEKTKYTNIQSLADLKPQDAVSVDYIVGAEGNLIGKSLSLEKPEEPVATPVAQPEDMNKGQTP